MGGEMRDGAAASTAAAATAHFTRDEIADYAFRRSYRQLVKLASLLVDDVGAAEEVVQDAFTRVLIRWDSIRDLAAFDVYLRTAVINGSRSELRRRRIRRLWARVEFQPPADGADWPVLLAAEHSAALRLVQGLPERQRQVIVLRYWMEMTEREISMALGISLGTVKSSAARAMQRITAGIREES